MDKRDLIYNCIELGMELKRAYYACELTQEEMDAFDKDESFQRRIKAKEAIVEQTLLQKLDQAIDFNLRRGETKELRFKLGAVNNRWKQNGSAAGGTGGVINIYTESVDIDKDDTVEVHDGLKDL